MRDAALPMFERVLGEHHPQVMWTSGQVGVCLLVCQGQGQGQGQGQEGSQLGSPSQAQRPSSSSSKGGPEALMNSALDFLATYEFGAFPSSHPWVQRLGGYDLSATSNLQGAGQQEEGGERGGEREGVEGGEGEEGGGGGGVGGRVFAWGGGGEAGMGVSGGHLSPLAGLRTAHRDGLDSWVVGQGY